MASSSPVLAAEDNGSSAGSPPNPLFGTRSQWVFSAEGLAAVAYRPNDEDTGLSELGGELRTTHSALSFLGLSPRIGADVFVTNHLSLGLGASYAQSTIWSETPNVQSSDGQIITLETRSTTRDFRTTPRVGLAYTSASGLGAWGRAGVDFGLASYVNDSNFPGRNTSSSFYGLSARLEVLGTYVPRPNLVLMAGPWIVHELTSWSSDSSAAPPSDTPPTFGFAAGAGVYL